MEGGGGSRIALSIKSQDEDIRYYHVPGYAKMLPLLRHYCKEKGVDYRSVTFICNGQRIKPSKTPIENGLESGDEIDVMVHQNGGGCSSTDIHN